jgi:hypothetical protein
MNTQELKDLFYKTRQDIVSNLISDLVKDAESFLTQDEYIDLTVKGHAARIIYAFYDSVLLNSLYDANNILSTFDDYDAFESIKENLSQAIIDFYDANPKLLNDNFTLNNNFYFTDLRCFIVDLEDSLRQERQGK